jgi:GTPase-associated protein 1, N-terminal domain type 2/GTPase-associated protein 1, C-terminal domain/GTPase-associated protein 1, middle domain
VAFQQLYYTSCEHGVGGYVGFQFNALSPGTGPRAMREVEQLTVYELPSWDSSTADAPVNLCHVRDAARGGTITANVVYAGTDFSGRTGNYFAHALVTADAETDFGDLLPAELWESPAWSRTQAASTTLPLMEAPLPRGSFDRPTVAAFLGAQPDARVVLTRLLSAVDKVMNEDRSLVLWTSSSTENAHWIAAVSYLLEAARAREMSFYTYTRRPAQCRAHVIGTVPGTVTSAAALADSFRVFDLTSRTMPEVEVHPLAELLAQVGVLRAAGLWRQAATLAAGTERSFDDWYPVAAAAAGLLGVEPLPSGAAGAMASWLLEAPSRSTPLPGPHIETVLTVLLDRHDELGDDQLRPLLSTAKEAGAIGQLQRIEITLVNRAVSRLERGQPPQGPIPLVTAEGIQLAATGCESLLTVANAATSMTVLDWARETGLGLDPQLVERCGRDVIGPALPSLDGDRRVVQVGQAYPAFASGVGAYLVAAGIGTAAQLFEGIAGELWASGALGGNPELGEVGLIEEVRLGKVAPLTALREVIGLRRSPASALSDEYLMARLWPDGLLTVGEATEMLSLLVGDMGGTPALRLLDRALQAPSRIYDVDAWLKLCDQTLVHRVCPQLPVDTGQRLESLRGLSGKLAEARVQTTKADMSWYDDFHDHIEGVLPPARDVLRQSLARLTLEAPQSAEQLARCSDPVFAVTCDEARMLLAAKPPNHPLAARLFQAFEELRGLRSPRARQVDDRVLAPIIHRWSRRDKARVAALLNWQGRRVGRLQTLLRPDSLVSRRQRRPDLSAEFKLWCENENNARAGNSAIQAVRGGGSVGSWIRHRGQPARNNRRDHP